MPLSDFPRCQIHNSRESRRELADGLSEKAMSSSEWLSSWLPRNSRSQLLPTDVNRRCLLTPSNACCIHPRFRDQVVASLLERLKCLLQRLKRLCFLFIFPLSWLPTLLSFHWFCRWDARIFYPGLLVWRIASATPFCLWYKASKALVLQRRGFLVDPFWFFSPFACWDSWNIKGCFSFP